jgi:hypothetical protein
MHCCSSITFLLLLIQTPKLRGGYPETKIRSINLHNVNVENATKQSYIRHSQSLVIAQDKGVIGMLPQSKGSIGKAELRQTNGDITGPLKGRLLHSLSAIQQKHI